MNENRKIKIKKRRKALISAHTQTHKKFEVQTLYKTSETNKQSSWNLIFESSMKHAVQSFIFYLEIFPDK